jgi:hypothetical protein
MMTGFDHARGQIKVAGILVSTQIAKKYAREVVVVKFPTSFPGTLYTYTSAKQFQRGEVWLEPKVAFKRSFACDKVYQMVVEIDHVNQRCRPELGMEAGHVEQCSHLECKMTIVDFNSAIPRMAVCTSWLDLIVKFL